MPSGACVAAMIRPPQLRCSRINPENMSWPATSSAVVGSSSSQTGRRTVSRRASESRRRWPADRKGGRQMGGVVEADDGEAFDGVKTLAAEKIGPECQILRRAQGRLQGVAMTEIVALLRQGELGIASVQRDRAARRNEQARDQPQQRRLARSVAAHDRHGFAGAGLEIEPGKHVASAPHANHPASGKLHRASYQSAQARPQEILG
ncbi:hypothetical protein ACVWZZ_004686 [Bradyrhizobium sp. LM6.10]